MALFSEDEVAKPTKPKKKVKGYTQEQAYVDIYNLLPEEWVVNDAFELIIDDWLEHRMELNPYKTRKAIKMFVNKLIKLAKGDMDIAIMLVSHAIEKGWDTVWEPSYVQNKTYKPVRAESSKYDKFDGG